MDSNVTAAIIGAAISVFVVFLSNTLCARSEFRAMGKKEDRVTRLDALSPLRTNACECYVRFCDIKLRIAADQNKSCPLLTLEKKAASMSAWGRRDGCYLISTCYFIASLQCYLYRAKAAISYL